MIDVTSRLCQGKRGVDRGGRGVCERACRGRAARMATPAAMCATHRLTTSPCARVTPRARARARGSRSRRTHVAHVSRRAPASAASRRERRGRDALDVRCGLGPGAGLGRALALEAFSPRERGASQAARRGAIGVAEWGSGEYDGGFDDPRRLATPGGSFARRRSFSLDEDANLGSRLDALC